MPTEELENELRRVLAHAAADIQDPQQAGQRLLQRNYRPGRGHRRLAAGITAATAAAAVVLGLGLSGAFGSAPARSTGTIRTMSFTLVSHHNGTATLTINPDELLDTTALQNDLKQDGIPALVTSGRFCFSNPAPAGFWQVLGGSMDPKNMPKASPRHPRQVDFGPENPPTITFNPAAIPAGTELSFGDISPSPGGDWAQSHMHGVVMGLIDANSYTCNSHTMAEVSQLGAEAPFGFWWPAGQS